MKINFIKHFNLFLLILCISQVSNIYAHEKEQDYSNQKYFSGLNSEAAKVVMEFHHALQNADEDTVKKILADDVIIFEGGGVERSASEYANHHMKADMGFLKQMQITILEHHVKVNGNTALSMSRNHMQGHYKDKDKDIDSEGMETLLLMKMNKQWKIVHIHWSN